MVYWEPYYQICQTYLPHSLLIAKLQAYGFDRTSIEYLKRLFELSETKDKSK